MGRQQTISHCPTEWGHHGNVGSGQKLVMEQLVLPGCFEYPIDSRDAARIVSRKDRAFGSAQQY